MKLRKLLIAVLILVLLALMSGVLWSNAQARAYVQCRITDVRSTTGSIAFVAYDISGTMHAFQVNGNGRYYKLGGVPAGVPRAYIQDLRAPIQHTVFFLFQNLCR